jgi:lipoprotein-releasing system permease protein
VFRTFLSWRYLLHRRTNLIGIGGIFVGVAALIMILSIMTGFLEETRRTVRGSLADLVITPYFEPRGDGSRPPSDPGRLLAEVRRDPRVAGASAHMVWWGQVTKTGRGAAQSMRMLASSQFGDRSLVQIVGIDFADELQASEIDTALRNEPRFVSRDSRVADPEQPFAPPPGYDPDGRPRPSAILGEQLLRQHGLHRGDTINVVTVLLDERTGELVPSNREFVVAGTFRSGENEMDLQRIYVERAELVDFLSSDTSYSEVLVKLEDYERDGRAVCAEWRESLAEKGLLYGRIGFGGPEEVRTWEEFRQTLLGAIENERVLMGIMLSLVLLVAGFTVFAILSMMVTEKRRDIGVLTALGATPRGVLVLFLQIGFWDALIGGTLGLVGGTWAALEIDAIEQWLSRTLGIQIFDRNVYLFDTIPSVVQPAAVASFVLLAFVCALGFAAWPAWKAARLDPLDALRYE